MPMTICITGGGGYLGTVLTRRILQSTPHKVVILDRFDRGVAPLTAVVQSSTGNTLRVQVGDIRDSRLLRDATEGVDAIIHLAGTVGTPACAASPTEAHEVNVAATQQLITYATGRPIIFASTSDIYGSTGGRPASEEDVVTPTSIYAHTKYIAEQDVLAAYGCAFRMATIYGPSPAMRWDLMPHHFARMASQGQISLYGQYAYRTLIAIEDVAKAYLFALDKGLTGLYNLGRPEGNLTKGDIALMYMRLSGCELISEPKVDDRDYTCNYRSILATGWAPSLEPFGPAAVETLLTLAAARRDLPAISEGPR